MRKNLDSYKDVDKIVTKIYNTRQGKIEFVRAYSRRMKELIGKMEDKPADGLKKRCFFERLTTSLHRKMEVIQPPSFVDVCTHAMDIESESKTSKGRRHGSKSKSSEESGYESKTIQALRKDMMRMMKEVTTSKEEKKEGK